MKLIFSYLKRHTALIAALAAATAIFALVFSLYGLPTEPVAYASALTIAVYAALGAVRFSSFKRKHAKLIELERSIETELGKLPPPSSLVEEDYQRLLASLDASKRSLATELGRRAADTEEYYTLWAHQIKTPIAAIRLLLEESPEDAQLSAELFKIEQYVDMVLNFVRAEGGEDIVLRRCNIDDIVRGCVRKYARLFVLSRLKLDFSPTGLVALTDEKWLAFSIEQIISNSLKYTRSGGISIYAEGEALVIADTGIGIAPEDLPRVFDKGYTGYNGRADKKSTGIGLYLTKLILNRLGHGITMTSAVGEGTTVRIELSSYDARYE